MTSLISKRGKEEEKRSELKLLYSNTVSYLILILPISIDFQKSFHMYKENVVAHNDP